MQSQRNGMPRAAAAPVAGDSVVERMEKRADDRAQARNARVGTGSSDYEEAPKTAQRQGQSREPQSQQDRQVQRQRGYQQEVDVELLAEKEQKISELTEMVEIMSEKMRKLEQLVRIKDSKIEALSKKMEKHGVV